MYFCTHQPQGKMPEWSNGPHSKCGERVTAPWVRIPVSPHCDENQFIMYTIDKLILFFIADNLGVSLLQVL